MYENSIYVDQFIICNREIDRVREREERESEDSDFILYKTGIFYDSAKITLDSKITLYFN